MKRFLSDLTVGWTKSGSYKSALYFLTERCCGNDACSLDSVYIPAPPAGCVPGQGDHIHLGLFADRQALYRMFEAEGMYVFVYLFELAVGMSFNKLKLCVIPVPSFGQNNTETAQQLQFNPWFYSIQADRFEAWHDALSSSGYLVTLGARYYCMRPRSVNGQSTRPTRQTLFSNTFISLACSWDTDGW